MSDILVLNGPNLGRLGSREPATYGADSYADLVTAVTGWAAELGLVAEVRQSEAEAELIQWLHEAVDTGRHVVLNAGAYTHYSYAIRDAATLVTAAGLTLVEVHLTNTAAREEFRHNSVITAVATGVVAGFGFESYRMALQAIAARI